MTPEDDRITQAERHLREAEAALAKLATTTDPEHKARILDDALRSLALAETAVDGGSLSSCRGRTSPDR